MGEALRGWGPAVLAWVLVANLGRGDDAARRRVRWVLLGLACSLTAQIPFVYDGLGGLAGWPHAARLVSHAGMVFTAWAAQEFMAVLNGRPRGPRWQAWWAAGAFTVMCLLFATLPDLLPQSPRVMEYCLVYAAAQLPALLTVIGLGVRYARQAHDRVIRASLLLVVAGTALALLYLVNKSVLAAAPRLAFEFPLGRTVPLSKILPTTAYLLVLIGAALPAGFGWWRRYRLFRRLGPLWRALYRADPAIALDPPAVPDALVLRNLRHRLYRRVIEIRDGLLALQPYRSAEAGAAARARTAACGLDDRKAEAAVEAAVVAAALAARAAGTPPGPPPAVVSGGTDLDADTEYLSRVSAAYRDLCRSGPASASPDVQVDVHGRADTAEQREMRGVKGETGAHRVVLRHVLDDPQNRRAAGRGQLGEG